MTYPSILAEQVRELPKDSEAMINEAGKRPVKVTRSAFIPSVRAVFVAQFMWSLGHRGDS